MTVRVSISRRTALELLSRLPTDSGMDRAGEELRRALQLPQTKVEPTRKQEKAKKTRAKRASTKEIRAVVLRRAGARCESCYRTDALELDHFFGRAKVPQSVANCWLLCRSCHRAKTDGRPSAAFWLREFIGRATKHGYTAEAGRAQRRLDALTLSGRAEGRGR